MDLYFNECSFHPAAKDCQEAYQRIVSLLETAKALRPYGFNIVRAHNGFFYQDIGGGYSVNDFISHASVTLRTLLMSVIRSPFIPDPNSYEAEIFLLHRFETENEQGVKVEPEGLAAACVYDAHSISLPSCAHWEQETLRVDMSDGSLFIESKHILNHALPSSVNTPAFQIWQNDWKNRIPLDSLENIQKRFPPARFLFESQALEDFLFWWRENHRVHRRVVQLIEDIENHPFSGGIGKTETLASGQGKASKRITDKDRLVYTFSAGLIVIHQCRGHYGDH